MGRDARLELEAVLEAAPPLVMEMLPWRETCTFAVDALLGSERVGGDAARARGDGSAIAAGDGAAAPPPTRPRAGGAAERAPTAILPCRVTCTCADSAPAAGALRCSCSCSGTDVANESDS